MFSIIGSGFGLYGYLPALVGWCSQRVILPERYRLRFGNRPELARFAGDIEWEPDEAAAFDRADGVAIAQRPLDQDSWIEQSLARPHIRRLLVEKPLAASPEAAGELFERLVRSGRTFRVGYIFRHTEWGRRFLDSVLSMGPSDRISIRWDFLAHHFQLDLNTWKRVSAAGGGALRFYGIQVIALLAESGYRDVVTSEAFGASPEEPDAWTAVFDGPDRPVCRVRVDTKSAIPAFEIRSVSMSAVSAAAGVTLVDPFDLESVADRPDDLDRRVRLLGPMCRSLWERDGEIYEWYDATIALWRRTEEKTEWRKGAHGWCE